MKLTAVDAMMKSFPDIPTSIAICISVAKAEVEASETLLSFRQTKFEILLYIAFDNRLLNTLHMKLLVTTVLVKDSLDVRFGARGNEKFEPRHLRYAICDLQEE